jgi:Zn-dependent alcohol dehydrogenase
MWERVLALLDAGQLEAERIVGGRWNLEHWQEAFETMHHGEVAKSLLVVNPSTAN